MKKIYFLLSFIICSFICFAQFPQTQTTGNSSTQVYSRGGQGADSGFIYRTNFTDTVAANGGFIKNIPGITIRVGNNIYLRNSLASAWILVGQRFGLEDNTATSNRAFDLDGNVFTLSGGKYQFNTSAANTLSIGSPGGVETGVLYTTDGTVLRFETRNSAGMSIVAGSQISMQAAASSGQLVFNGLTSNYLSQDWYTGGGGLIGQQGISVYDALNDESQFYLKALDSDTTITYLTLYDKMKFIDIPNDNTITKIIGLDASDNVRYIDASSIGGGGLSGGNLGAGYRYYVPASSGIKTTIADNGLSLDSATANILTYKLGGTLTANTTVAQSSNSMNFTGTGVFTVGSAIPTSTARLQVLNPTTGTQHFASGQFLSNNVYNSFYSLDTLTTASFKSTGLYNRYKHFMSASNLTVSGWGIGNDWAFSVPDTMRLNPVGSDLASGMITRSLMEPNTAYTGSHRVQQGLFKDDYVGGIVAAIQNDNTNTTNWIYRRGYSASVIAHYITGGTKDSADFYAAFFSTALNSGRILKAAQFYAGPIGNVDSLYPVLAPYAGYNYLYSSLRLGGDVVGNIYVADPSAMLDVSNTAKGILIPRMTAVQEAAISSPAPYLMLVNTDSVRVRVNIAGTYKSIAFLDDIPTGSGAVTWNSITNPTGSQTLSFDDGEVSAWTNGSNTETFLTITNNSLTTGTVGSLTTSSLTSGNIISLVSTSTALAANNEMLNIDMSGANGTNAITATGIRISVTNTNATSGTNIGIDATASGATTGNIGIRATPNLIVGTVSPNSADGVRIKNPGNGNYDGYYVESSGGTTGTTYGYAGVTRGGGYDFHTTSGSISLSPTVGVYVGTAFTAATALLHIKGGTTAASTAPLKFTSGTSMTSAEVGAVEFTTDDLFFTITTGTARKKFVLADPTGGLTSGRVPVATTNGRLTDYNNFLYDGTQLTLGTSLPPAGTIAFYNTQTITRQGTFLDNTINSEVSGTPSVLYVRGTIVEAASGTHSLLAGTTFTPPTVTGGGATVTSTATVAIGGAMSATVTGRNFALTVSGEASFSSAVSNAITSTSSTITLDNTYYTVKCDATGGAITINLPDAAGCTGRVYIVKKIDVSGNAVTLDGSGGQTLDGAATKVLSAQWATATIQSDGSDWIIISTI